MQTPTEPVEKKTVSTLVPKGAAGDQAQIGLESLMGAISSFITTHASHPTVGLAFRRHLDVALTHIEKAHEIHTAPPPADLDKPVDANEHRRICEAMSPQERYMLKHVGNRGPVASDILSSDNKRLIELGLIKIEESQAGVTPKGQAILDRWQSPNGKG